MNIIAKTTSTKLNVSFQIYLSFSDISPFLLLKAILHWNLSSALCLLRFAHQLHYYYSCKSFWYMLCQDFSAEQLCGHRDFSPGDFNRHKLYYGVIFISVKIKCGSAEITTSLSCIFSLQFLIPYPVDCLSEILIGILSDGTVLHWTVEKL